MDYEDIFIKKQTFTVSDIIIIRFNFIKVMHILFIINMMKTLVNVVFSTLRTVQSSKSSSFHRMIDGSLEVVIV